jgi:hypothetical protein
MNNINKQAFAIFFFLLTLFNLALAAPAYQGDIEFKNSDGSSFVGTLKGDEYFSWIENKELDIIVYNDKNKNYEYGKFIKIDNQLQLVPSGIKVGDKLQPASSYYTNTYLIKEKKENIKKLYKIWKQKKEKIQKKTQKPLKYRMLPQ